MDVHSRVAQSYIFKDYIDIHHEHELVLICPFYEFMNFIFMFKCLSTNRVREEDGGDCGGGSVSWQQQQQQQQQQQLDLWCF